MRTVLIALGIAGALGGTAGMAYVALRPARHKPEHEQQSQVPKQLDKTVEQKQPDLPIRPFETTLTLVEDLRDALAGDPKRLNAECWRVSESIGTSARWTLGHLAPEGNLSSPRVRALLVLAAGVHTQGDGLLEMRLADSDPRVRRAAILASAYRSGGEPEMLLGVTVPIGRRPDDRMRRELESLAKSDPDESVRATARLVLGIG